MTKNSVLRESPVKYIEWSIQNFLDQPTENYYSLESDYFSLQDAKWRLRIYTNGDGRPTINNPSGYISLYLIRKESVSEHLVTVSIGIKNADSSELKAVNLEHTFEKNTVKSIQRIRNFIQRSTLLCSKDKVAPDGTLTVFCTLRIMNISFASSANVESASQTDSDGTSTLIGDLKNLHISSRHADITIAVQGKEFLAHRSILSSRSSVFESMFLHDMEEKNCGSVEITDCDPDAFEDFLLFLYTGKFDNVSSSNAVSLYITADKYDVKELKDYCVRCMINELSNDVICDFLLFATMQNEKHLLNAVTDYFIENAKTIIITTKWQTFLAEHPILGNELFIKLLNSKDDIEE